MAHAQKHARCVLPTRCFTLLKLPHPTTASSPQSSARAHARCVRRLRLLPTRLLLLLMIYHLSPVAQFNITPYCNNLLQCYCLSVAATALKRRRFVFGHLISVDGAQIATTVIPPLRSAHPLHVDGALALAPGPLHAPCRGCTSHAACHSTPLRRRPLALIASSHLAPRHGCTSARTALLQRCTSGAAVNRLRLLIAA